MRRFYRYSGCAIPSSNRLARWSSRTGAARALAPENTIAAFDKGLALGADGLELDVRLSRDGVVVVHHDATLDRTTEPPGAVAALDARELARADAGYRFSGARRPSVPRAGHWRPDARRRCSAAIATAASSSR